MKIIGRRRRTFIELANLLRAVECNPEDLVIVQNLNIAILKAVIRTEKDILRHKGNLKWFRTDLKTGRNAVETTILIRRRIKETEAYVARYVSQLWLWKLFGDALTYSYLDKFSIKHAYFDVDEFQVKRDAGMVHGKSGLPNEIGLMLSAIEHNLPAVLCDITNVLRYGDVCLLGGSDPYILEVKSKNRLNQRGKRQAAKLETLNNFLRDDRATAFRGGPGETIRQAFAIPERTHVEALNECIRSAQDNGFCMINPEPGLYYIASYGGHVTAHEQFYNEKGPSICFSWNEAKNVPEWAPYVPFLLTIRDPSHIVDFVDGRLIIHVWLNTSRLVELMSVNGWQARLNERSPYAIECFHAESQRVMGLSAQFVARIGYECTSLEWVAQTNNTAMTDAIKHICDLPMPADSPPSGGEWQKLGIEYESLFGGWDHNE